MSSRASHRRYQSRIRPKWWTRRGHLRWTQRGIPLRLAEKYTSWWGSYISSLYDWQQGLLRRLQTKQKMTNMKLPVCWPRWRPKSKVCLLAMVSILGRLPFCRLVLSNPLVPLWLVFQLYGACNHVIHCVLLLLLLLLYYIIWDKYIWL